MNNCKDCANREGRLYEARCLAYKKSSYSPESLVYGGDPGFEKCFWVRAQYQTFGNCTKFIPKVSLLEKLKVLLSYLRG